MSSTSTGVLFAWTLSALDHLLTTHWHGDHHGAMEAPAGRVPIRHYIDHGPARVSAGADAAFTATNSRNGFAKTYR